MSTFCKPTPTTPAARGHGWVPLFMGFALCSATSFSHAAGLNDTGITDCWNNTTVINGTGIESDTGTHPRQDCRYGRDPAAAAGTTKVGGGSKGFDFTKIANDGTALPASVALGTGLADWACTRDNVTGLIWEVKTTSGLRSQSHSYTWFSSDPTSRGGWSGEPSGGTCETPTRCDTEKYVADVNAAPGLCGATNWRMPSKSELMSILDYGKGFPPFIDSDYFRNTVATAFWSASPYAGNDNNAWSVDFTGGYAENNFKATKFPVRLVRSVP